jgi:hypothetical protein
MFEKLFKRTKKESVTSTERSIIPKEIFNRCIKLGKNEGKAHLIEFLKTLPPSKLLDYKMTERLDWPQPFRDWADEAFWAVEWNIDWPYGKQMDTTISDLIIETIPITYQKQKDDNGRERDLDLNDLVRKVDGMQKKLDKVETLISNAEFKITGKDAMKL